jgi:hypothetical protein
MGALADDFVGLAAELGEPAATVAQPRPPAADLRDWIDRARAAIEARVPSDGATGAEWDAADRVLEARQRLELRVALAVSRGLAGASEPLRRVVDVAGRLERYLWSDAPWEHAQGVIDEIADLMTVLESDPATPLEFTSVIAALVRDIMHESAGDELPEAIHAGLARLTVDVARAALRDELAPWLLDPEGAPHRHRIFSEAERLAADPPPEGAPVPVRGDDALRERIPELSQEQLVRVLIAMAEVELFECALPAEAVSRAEAALAAARAWLREQTTHRCDEAWRAGEQARDLLAGLAATSCARFAHVSARLATDVLAAMPPGELRTMVYLRLDEELRAMGYRS